MLKLIIDNITVPVDSVYEHLNLNRLNASKSFTLKETKPDISGLVGKTSFNTLKLLNEDGNELSLYGIYNTIQDFNTEYGNDYFAYNLTLIKNI